MTNSERNQNNISLQMSGHMGWFDPVMRGGVWDPYGVRQHNYIAWFVFYIENAHFWIGDLKNVFLASPYTS